MAPIVNGQKYFLTIVLARSWKKYSSVAIMAKRPVRIIADTPKNKRIGYPIKPNQIASNLYGIGVTAVSTIINMPYFENIGLIVLSIRAGFENVSISHIPTESYSHIPIIYANAPPTIEPKLAAMVIGNARRLFAIIGGVIKTSGGINRNIDSHIVNKNTTHEYARDSDFCSINSENFMFCSFEYVKIYLIVIKYNLFYNHNKHLNKRYFNMKKQFNSNRGERIASKVQTIVAEILRDNYADDKIVSGVSLVGSVAHGGLQFVRLFYYTRNPDVASVQHRLDEITRTVRFELAGRMNQKYVPDIKFAYDDTLEKAARIDELLNNL